MTAIIYTLPNDTNSKILRNRLIEKEIPYIEIDFNQLNNPLVTSVPHMLILRPGKTQCYYSFEEIMEWVDNYQPEEEE